MADIALRPLQRTELPPSRVGEVKPPLSLADRSGEIGLAIATAKFAGDRFNKLVATKAANEIAAFQGMVNTEIENFNTFVKSRPGASFGELETERNKMITRLESASKNAVTSAGKQSIKNWMLKNVTLSDGTVVTNKGLIYAKTQTNMEAIRTMQELATANEHIKNFMNTGDVDGLENFYFGEDGLVQSGLVARDFAQAQFTNQKAIMVDAAKKLAADNAVTIGLDAWEASKAEFGPAGSKKAGFAAIQALEGMSGDDKALAESKLNVQVNNRRAEDKLALEVQQEKDLDAINQLLFIDKDYTKATQAINASSLDEATQGTLFADTERRAAAAAKGVPLTNDRVEEARLYEKSLDIWRGTVTKQDFDADLITNQHKLDDSAYQRVSSSAANTLKSSQAEALRRADTEAGRLIVDFRDEDSFKKFIADSMKGLSPDAASLFQDTANENRQLQFFSLSRYNAELRQWIEENPDKLGKDFFQFSESLKHDYWNQSIEDLTKLRERVAGEFVAEEFLRAHPLETKPVVTITTRAERDKLPKGTRYRGPDGNIAVKQ